MSEATLTYDGFVPEEEGLREALTLARLDLEGFSGAIFDVDGVLVDSPAAEVPACRRPSRAEAGAARRRAR